MALLASHWIRPALKPSISYPIMDKGIVIYDIKRWRDLYINILEPPTECLVQMPTLILKCNNFTFNGEHLFTFG